MKKELSFPISSFLNLSENYLKDIDSLDFLKLSKMYVDNFVLNDLNSWMHFISWVWWSWKTTFINYVLLHLKKHFEEIWKQIVVIPVSPRIINNTNTLLNDFLDLLSSELLKLKYDRNIKRRICDLKVALDKSWLWYLKVLSSIVWRNSSNIQDTILSVRKSIDNTYKDYEIVFVIDDIDRVWKNELILIWKVLDIIQKLIFAWDDKDWNILCFYAADSRHLNSFTYWDWADKNYLNFYQYFHKFWDEQPYDVYHHSKWKLEKIFYKKFNIEQNYDFSIMFDRLQASLEKSWLPLTIRSINHLIEQFKWLTTILNNTLAWISFDEPLVFMNKTIVKDILNKLFNPILNLQILWFLCYLEKDPWLFDIFDKYTNELKYLDLNDENNLEKFNNEIKKLEGKWIYFDWLSYYDSKWLLSFFNSNDYILIRNFCKINNIDYTLKKFVNQEYLYRFANDILGNNNYTMTVNDYNFINSKPLWYSNFLAVIAEITSNIHLIESTEQFDNFCNNIIQYINYPNLSFENVNNFSECILRIFDFCTWYYDVNYFYKKFNNILKIIDETDNKFLWFYFYSHCYFYTINTYNHSNIQSLWNKFDEGYSEYIKKSMTKYINNGKWSLYFWLKAIEFWKLCKSNKIDSTESIKHLVHFIDLFIWIENHEFWLDFLNKISTNMLFLTICTFVQNEWDDLKYVYGSSPSDYWKLIYKIKIKPNFIKLFKNNYSDIKLYWGTLFSSIKWNNSRQLFKIVDEYFWN